MDYSTLLFCDFDGTITSTETLAGFLRLINPPGSEVYENGLRQGRMTLSQAIPALFSLVPSERLLDLFRYIDSVPLRDGFERLLSRLSDNDIPFVLLSAGVGPMIDRKLGKFYPRMLDVYGSELDVSGPYMRLHSAWDDGVEMVSKSKVMAQYSCKTSICIGDGMTDLSMASASQIVFARDDLAAAMEKSGRAYYPWNDFDDVVQKLEELHLIQKDGG